MKLRSILLAAAASLVTGVLVSQAQVPGINSTLNSVFTLAYDNSSMKPTYSASAPQFATAASATDICILNGSATKTVKVRRIMVGLWGSAVVTEPVSIVLRSAANTAGTGAVVAGVSYDSSNSAATAQAESWTANPTLGTLTGLIADLPDTIGLSSSAGAVPTESYTFGELGQPIVLRGTAQGVAVNLSGITIAGGQATCFFEWTEE